MSFGRILRDPLTLAFGDKVEIEWHGKTIETTVVFVDHNVRKTIGWSLVVLA